MPGYQHLKRRVLLFSLLCASCRGAELREIIRGAIAAIQSDWSADVNYSYVERDEVQKDNKLTSRTSRVVMMGGSDYYMPIATDDRPLAPEQQKAERQKLRNEFQRRNREGAESRRRRIATYQKARAENGALLPEFPKAFVFEVLRKETMNGHPAWALSATPVRRSGPLSRAAKVLSGMRGTVWLEREHYHAIRAECQVFRPVPIYGILARVLPGTHIELQMSPVTDSIWLMSEFSMTLTVSKFWFRSTQVTHATYTDYRLNAEVLAELLSEEQRP
ncbi:MAG TPA: hypothetical protein VHB50_13845 [Bryobacteraceae bacterium]|nr:hypothetical protein [Bryobacteraceae bacterium]